jgi:hypothetical protein
VKRTLNIVGKDLRRVAWPLVLWAVIAVCEQAFVWKQLWFAPIDSKTLGRVLQVLSSLEFGVTFLVAAAIVQQDRLVGTNAWWLTRPVSRGRLFVAKALAVGIACIALPVIARLPLWSLLHFKPRDLAWAITEIGAKQLLVVLPAVAVASLTDNFGRFIVWSMVLAFVILTGPVLWGGMALLNIPNGNPLQQSRAVVELAILVLTGAAVIVTQYSFRRVAASVVVLTSGLALTAMVAPRWTLDLRELRLKDGRSRDLHAERARDVALKIRSVQFDLKRWSAPVVDFDVPGVPAGTQWTANPIEHTLRWPTGITLRLDGPEKQGGWNDAVVRAMLGLKGNEPRDPETERWFADRQAAVRSKYPSVRTWTPLSADARAVIPLRASIAALIPQQRPTYTLGADLHLIKPQLAFEIAIKPGARSTGAGNSVHIVDVHTRQSPDQPRGINARPRQELAVTKVIGWPVLLRDQLFTSRQPNRFFGHWRVPQGTPTAELILDRAINAVVSSYDYWNMDVVVDCIAISRETGSAGRGPMNRRGDAWVPADPDFLNHATIAVVRFPELARVWREARIEHLTFAPSVNRATPTSVAPSLVAP